MNFHKLTVFCEVVERGSLTAAAEHLYVSQPVVSAHLRDVEEFFGAKLLVKDGRRMIVTDAGRAVYAYAREAQRATEETRRLASALETGEAGCCTIGGSQVAGGYYLPRLLAEFSELHPRIEIRLGVADPDDVFDRVRRGFYDFGVVTSTQVPPSLHGEIIGYEPLVLTAAPDHPLANAHAIDPRALDGHAVVYPLLPSTQAWTDTRLRELGISNVRVVMAASSMEALKYMVAAGRGLALLHRCCAEPDLRSGRLVALDVAGPSLRQPVFLAHAVRKHFAPAQARLLAFLKTGAAMTRAIGDTIAADL